MPSKSNYSHVAGKVATRKTTGAAKNPLIMVCSLRSKVRRC